MRMDSPEIYEDLKRRLITGGFPPGDKIKPSDLQGHYGCSANTIRDLLLRLSSAGLVVSELQRGFRARMTTAVRRHDVTQFRIILELEGAALSMRNGGLRWESRLAAAHHKLWHIETEITKEGETETLVELWSDAETEFHETLISGCGSDVLRETYANVYLQFRQQVIAYEREFRRSYFHAIIEEHQAILDAALARDEDRCRQTIYDHLKRNLEL